MAEQFHRIIFIGKAMRSSYPLHGVFNAGAGMFKRHREAQPITEHQGPQQRPPATAGLFEGSSMVSTVRLIRAAQIGFNNRHDRTHGWKPHPQYCARVRDKRRFFDLFDQLHEIQAPPRGSISDRCMPAHLIDNLIFESPFFHENLNAL